MGLQTRYFKVKVGSSLSSRYEQKNGVPQGAVLSVILFALKINGIAKKIPNNPNTIKCLFVDDLQLGVRGLELEKIGKTLQSYLNIVQKWTESNGFRFSPSKTNVVHFTKLNSIAPPPQLKLGNQQLVYKPSARFLGLHFDSKLTWNPHLKKLKSECQKMLGIMKMISYQSYGATQACLMKIYRIYTRSKLDYGSIVYASVTRSELQKLDVVANEALRIATGAFASTPVESFSTTPLRSGLVPLAPVGPHELSSFISGLSWAHETNVEVYAMEDRRMHVKHLNKGVSGFVDNALQ